jgi:hypothetical protein
MLAHIANLVERCLQDLVANPEGKRLLGRPRHRWEVNTKMGREEVHGSPWLRIEAFCGLLRMRQRMFGIPVRFSGKTVVHGVSYLVERAVSVDTTVSESETMCDSQVEQICLKKNLSENLSHYCQIYLRRKISCSSK